MKAGVGPVAFGCGVDHLRAASPAPPEHDPGKFKPCVQIVTVEFDDPPQVLKYDGPAFVRSSTPANARHTSTLSDLY